MWFGKAVQDFNASITSQGEQGAKLVANTGNAFTSALYINDYFDEVLTNVVVWVAYAFLAVPIIASLSKLNVMVSKK